MSRDETEDTAIYNVVVNDEQQYSIWPADRENALGSTDVGKSGPKAECLFNGAEPVRLESRERFAKTFAVAGFRREAFFPCYGLAEGTLIVSGGARDTLPMSCVVEADALEHNRIIPATSAEKSSRTLVGCGQVLALRFPACKVRGSDVSFKSLEVWQ